jgi:hypothetical protein
VTAAGRGRAPVPGAEPGPARADGDEALIRVTRGRPCAEELAAVTAVTAVLLGLRRQDPPGEPLAPAPWGRPAAPAPTWSAAPGPAWRGRPG